jgi:putative inorganic carbon (hco3(-)) transporter
MTVAEARTRMPVSTGLVAALALAASVAILTVATGRSPVEVAVPIVGVIGGIAVLRSPTLALSLLIASAFFEGYLTRSSLSMTKVIGVAAVLAWGIDWVLRRRRLVTTPHMVWLGGLAVWLGTSLLLEGSPGTVARYASFFVLFFLTVQVASRGRRRLELLVTVTVASAAGAAALGLFDYLVVHHGRAAGPLAGANDFAFLLGSALPLAVWRFRWAGGGWQRLAWVLAALMIATTTTATLSRGAALGLGAGFLWLVLAGRVRPRWLLGAALVIGFGWALSATVLHSQISTATATKEQVAASNVQSRLYYWQIAIDEFRSAPLTGVGAGNYRERFTEFGLPFAFDTGAQGTHNTYLNILAELGLTGLVLFVGYLVSCWRDLRMRFADRRADELQSALAASFVTACIAAIFLTEQYYAPLWVLPALGVSAVLRVRGGARL